MPNCTAIPTSAFSTAPANPKNLPKRRRDSGIETLAITDHDGFYGVVRFAEAAGELGVRTVFGAELSLGLRTPQNGIADPEGDHLLVLARDPEGYRRLSMAISRGATRRQGEGSARSTTSTNWRVARRSLGRFSPVAAKVVCPKPLSTEGFSAAAAELDRLVALFGRDNVFVELTDHGNPLDSTRNDALFDLAGRRRSASLPPPMRITRLRAEGDSLRHWPPSAVVVVLTTWTVGCLLPALHTCARVLRWRRGSRVTRVPSTWPPRSVVRVPSTCGSLRHDCRISRCRPDIPR